ncbi:hypothetical protein XFF6992_220144 [Xanthomonas citri pv. fuscans]|nr:hypothetical protein XFF6992_220144 [Xanthomonas citri pv. fuscans]SOO31965.1 hypothetical protein XFF6994_1600005 [Xanthomonas citri pv. fuscans]
MYRCSNEHCAKKKVHASRGSAGIRVKKPKVSYEQLAKLLRSRQSGAAGARIGMHHSYAAVLSAPSASTHGRLLRFVRHSKYCK